MRIPSGVTDQYVYFVAVDSTDFATRETGLSSFTVYRSRDGAAAAAMTTPTVNETSAANMPGVYELLLDEDMTIGSGNDSEEMCFHITHAGMAPVTRTIELYRPKITAGDTLATTAGAVDTVTLVTTTTTNTDMITAAAVNAEVDTAISDFWTTPATLVDLIWDEAQAGHVGAGTFGIIASEIADILVDTAQIGAAGAGLTDLGGMSTAMKAEVNAEVVDTLATDTYAEPGQELPASTTTLANKINYLYKAWRNKSTQTATTYSLFADDTTTVDQKATVSDNGSTATKEEIETGP